MSTNFIQADVCNLNSTNNKKLFKEIPHIPYLARPKRHQSCKHDCTDKLFSMMQPTMHYHTPVQNYNKVIVRRCFAQLELMISDGKFASAMSSDVYSMWHGVSRRANGRGRIWDFVLTSVRSSHPPRKVRPAVLVRDSELAASRPASTRDGDLFSGEFEGKPRCVYEAFQLPVPPGVLQNG